MNDLKKLQFTAQQGSVDYTEGGDLVLTVRMPPHAPDYSFVGEGDFETDEYFVL